MPYLVAAVTAAVIGLVEQYNRLNARRTLRNQAWVWWTARVVLEVALGLGAVALLRTTHGSLARSTLGWIGAGAGGSAVARLRLFDAGPRNASRPVGPAFAYNLVRGFIEDQLDKRCTERHVTWLRYNVLPRLERLEVPPERLANHLRAWVATLSSKTPAERRREEDYLVATRDGPEPDKVKRETLANFAVQELGAFRLVDQFVQAEEKIEEDK